MRFLIADTFMKSLARLSREDQALVKQAAFEFQAAPANPGFRFHKLERAKDPRFWSFRPERDIRIIVHRDGANSLMLCYADHHEEAYRWAERRTLEVHPTTGAAQFVEVQERVEEVVRRVVRDQEPPIFERFERDYLLRLGVPSEWVDALRTVGESAFMDIAHELPAEAAERLLELAAGKAVPLPTEPRPSDPFAHPDAQRRFRSLETQHELQAALDAPWDAWTVFLHPTQRGLVERRFGGPARVTGGAGTGKTVVGLHRAAHLARHNPDARVLLTTFSRALATRLEHSLQVLMGQDAARERIVVRHLHAVAAELALGSTRSFEPASEEDIATSLEVALRGRANDWLNMAFARSEWTNVVDAHGITTWEQYKAVPRKGRGVPLSAKRRALAWGVLEAMLAELDRRGLSTFNLLCSRAAAQVEGAPPYRHIVVDECQDFGPAELRLVRTLCPEQDDDLFFCGDEGQRIYKGRASWLSLGIDVRGRSSRLRLNYRTTEQIRRQADRLLPGPISDGDGASEAHDTVSLLNGPMPELAGRDSAAAESSALADWLSARRAEGLALHEIAVFARTHKLLEDRIVPALGAANLRYQTLDAEGVPVPDQVVTGTLHAAKGLEFRAVAVAGCDRDQVPLRSVARRMGDDADREDFIEHERHLLYVGLTRAREHLLVSWTGAECEWLEGAGR